MWVDAWVRARDGRPVWIRGLDSGLGLGRRERTVAILGAAVIADLIEEEDVVSSYRRGRTMPTLPKPKKTKKTLFFKCFFTDDTKKTKKNVIICRFFPHPETYGSPPC